MKHILCPNGFKGMNLSMQDAVGINLDSFYLDALANNVEYIQLNNEKAISANKPLYAG